SQLPTLQGAELAPDAPGAAAQHYRRVRLQGRWVPERTVYLENRTLNGQAGFIVITPLELDAGAGHAIVQRGWVARDFGDRTRLPALVSASEAIAVEGIVAPAPSRLFEFAGPAPGGPIRQNLDLAAYATETGLALRPLTIQQTDDAINRGDGLLRQWPRPAVDVHKHYGYAAQWFALAALITGLYVWFQLIAPRIRARR
ncbi:MAG: SURF1 family protein, partial [Burkholderiaceae bacterium]